ncbi:GNAT family N-acetyltransferase [Lactobacillus sp. LC28-10]|uniref:GNAT family N-acetyltransferase n=1 Tax=Secundilactobacillus angelensis TaxID=2722706 RepID=A0ABX1KYN6_9LACO|nr:GNAT family N-acetyltransferase [Secundilactobacillus angelensis]MCH5462325.1 GNAT family N-acetyltransferase [Secundilactobacillus angelensis]NLR19064.1 GNAT family N-acetyltransferase [Secundilactobacillus angelensis]
MKIESATGTKSQVYHDAANIRQAVFVKEQGISAKLEFDGLDDQVTHYVGYVEHQPVVTARIRHLGQTVHIQRVATLNAFRHHGYAIGLLQRVIAEMPPKSHLELNAQATAIGLYERLGFEQTGEPFEEVGIKHVKMVKNL